ncbi:MAG: alanine racemase [Burkholderiaceae bacterium]
MGRPLRACISIPALRHNLRRVRELAPAARVWAVVKANAYGHGLSNAIEAFDDAHGLALLEFDAAQRLREAGWRRPILMLEGPFEPADVAQARQQGLTLALHRPEHLDWLAEHPARGDAQRLDVLLKFNSGMNRLGMRAPALRDAHAALAGGPLAAQVGSVGLMTHFANADVLGGIDEAWPAFVAACQGLSGPRSVSNSAAIIDHPATHGDWVRPGVMLYGATPFASRDAAGLGLRPAMRLESELIAIQTLSAGESVGYGSLFTAAAPMRAGVVACGYADGYPRHAPVGTPVVVAGRRAWLAGRVAMDMLMVDLSDVPDARVGSPVQLWGDQLPIDEVAQAAGTVGYELMCALAPRVPVIVER